MHPLAGGTVFSLCNLRSQKSAYLRTQQPCFITNQGTANAATLSTGHRNILLCCQQQLVVLPLPQPLVISFPVAYSERKIKLGRSRTWHSRRAEQPGSAVPAGEELSLSSRLPSAETASSPSGSLQNTGLLIKRG